MFKVQCTSCRETHSNYVGVNRFVCRPYLGRVLHPDGLLTRSNQETNEMSGSRGEANFVWKCKNCKVSSYLALCTTSLPTFLNQRESSASIKAAAVPYEQGEPAKAQRLIEFDCRGLEFTDFKPEV